MGLYADKAAFWDVIDKLTIKRETEGRASWIRQRILGEVVKYKRVFDLVMHFGTSQSPKCTRSSTAYYCPGRPASVPLRHTIASSVLATQHSRKWLDAVFGCSLCFPFGAQAHVG